MPELVQPVVSGGAPPWFRYEFPQHAALPDYRVTFRKANGETVWQSNPGPQTWALHCPYDEILLGGARGGGKSVGLIAWMLMGDPALAEDDPARATFINDPDYRGLLLREQYQSMAEFVEEAVEFYRPFGGKAAGNPVAVTFKSGAKIYFNHLGDEESFNKYKGWNLTRIGVEELTQIQTLRRYLKLFGSLRSTDRIRGGKRYPKLRTQIMNTTNPDGPGQMFVKQRFIEVRDGKGNLIPWNTPMRDPISGLTRIFIPANIKDNPFLASDQKYMGMLLSQDDVTQAQWIRGDWNAGSGVFFSEYRPDGPIGSVEAEETPWARHRIQSAELKPWWYRWGSLDVGYDHPAAMHKFCRNERDKRIHVYDELQVRRVGSYELGVLLAKWWIPELEQLPEHQVTLYISPDAFSKRDESKTQAEQIETGIKEVLGPYGALMLRYNDDERAAMLRDPKAAAAMFERRKQEVTGRRQFCIVLKAANNDLKAGCSYMRELLRFRPVLTETEGQLKERLTEIYHRSGVEAYERELERSKPSGPEVLPKLQIWMVCKELDRCLKEAIRDEAPKNEQYRKFDAEDGVGGDDAIDDARYGLMGFKEIETTIPKSYWVADRVTEVTEKHRENFGEELTDPTRLAMIASRQAALYEKQHQQVSTGITLPRMGSSRHRVQ